MSAVALRQAQGERNNHFPFVVSLSHHEAKSSKRQNYSANLHTTQDTKNPPQHPAAPLGLSPVVSS